MVESRTDIFAEKLHLNDIPDLINFLKLFLQERPRLGKNDFINELGQVSQINFYVHVRV